jgi:site-specific DNA-methyltransferase (adenine-specific)
MSYQLLLGDCLEQMRHLPANSVQCCVTSPPYFGLRDYQVDGQIGLEESPDAYVAKLVDVFREVRRVLRHDATLWLNLGDSMLPNKCEAMIPHRTAMALMEDGWICRSTIIWHKPNPMPESVTDRPTKAHEYIFLLSKSQRYFYDSDAIAEKAGPPKICGPKNDASRNDGDRTGIVRGDGVTRNKRSVWTVATKPYAEAHFATFPEALIEPCILAGTSAKGCCAACGAPWQRVVEREFLPMTDRSPEKLNKASGQKGLDKSNGWGDTPRGSIATSTLGWQATCTCACDDVVPCTVLDPFAGSGTTLSVALKHGRRAIGCELNPEYIELAYRRISKVQPLLEMPV